MKRKHPAQEAVIDKSLLENAKRSVEVDRTARVQKCSVCGSACTLNSVPGRPVALAPDLCWVCRRLKISAWKDSEQQSAQE